MTVPAWLAQYRVTDDWAAHRARGSLGGVDWAAPAGTPIFAPSDGIVDYRLFPDGSSVIRVKRSDGTATEFLHGHLVGENRRLVTNMTRIGTSDGRRGQPGAGPSTGAHIHAHDVSKSGVRVPPFSTIGSLGPAGSGTTPPRKDNSTMLYYKLGSTPTLYALAGSSPGTPANWRETTDQNFANQLAAQVGGAAAGLTPDSFAAFKAAYLAPVQIAGGGGGGGGGAVLDDATIAKLAKANAEAFFAEQKKPGN